MIVMTEKRRTHKLYFKNSEGTITGKNLLLKKEQDNPAIFLAKIAQVLFEKGEYFIGEEKARITDIDYTYNVSCTETKDGSIPSIDEDFYVVDIELLMGDLSGVIELEIDNRNLDKKTYKKDDKYTKLCVKLKSKDYKIILETNDTCIDVYKQKKNESQKIQKSFPIDSETNVSEVQKYIIELLN